MTITTKIAKNGSINFYADGKRITEDITAAIADNKKFLEQYDAKIRAANKTFTELDAAYWAIVNNGRSKELAELEAKRNAARDKVTDYDHESFSVKALLEKAIGHLEKHLQECTTTNTNSAHVEPTTEEIIASINPEMIFKAVRLVRRSVEHKIDRNGKHIWYSYEGRIKAEKAEERLAEQGFRSFDEFFAAEKVADEYEDEVYWPRRIALLDQAKHLMKKIWTEVKHCDDNAEVFNLLPNVDDLNDVDDDTDAELIAPAEVTATKVENKEVYRPFTIEEKIEILNDSIADFKEQLAAVADKDSDEARELQESVADVTKERDDLAKRFNINLPADEPTDTTDETPEPPVDDFTAELAKLKAEHDAADKRVSKLNNDLLEAQKAAEKASNALYKFGDAKARELARDHLPALGFSKTTAVVTQDGDAIDAPNLRHIRIDFDFRKFKFEIVADWTIFGTYDTPEQVKNVIAGLKTALRREGKFTFPTVKGLTAPDIDNKDNLRGSLERAMEIACKKYHEYERTGDEASMLYEIELYSICADAIKELEAA